jgi:hypothetical protein
MTEKNNKIKNSMRTDWFFPKDPIQGPNTYVDRMPENNIDVCTCS